MNKALKVILTIAAIIVIAAGGIYSYNTYKKTDTVVVPIDSSLEHKISERGNEIVPYGYTGPNTDLTNGKIIFSSEDEFLSKIPKGEPVYVALIEKIYYGYDGPASPAYDKPKAIEKVYLTGPMAYVTEYNRNDYFITARTTNSITFYYTNELVLGFLTLVICAVLGVAVVILLYLPHRNKSKECKPHSCSG